MGKVLEAEGKEVIIPHGHTNTDCYHTRECKCVKKIRSPKKVDIALARDWKGYDECMFCQQIKKR